MKFEVNTTQISDTIKKLDTALSNISRNRLKMFQAIETLDSMWMGAAHDAFILQYSNDNEMMISFIEEVETVIDNINAAGQAYDTCEESVRNLASKIVI